MTMEEHTRMFDIQPIDKSIIPPMHQESPIKYLEWFIKMCINGGKICIVHKVCVSAYPNSGNTYYGATLYVSHWLRNKDSIEFRMNLWEKRDITIEYYPGILPWNVKPSDELLY